MNNKEYKNRLAQMDIYGGRDYLTRDEAADLRAEIKDLKRRGAVVLEGFNNRAAVIPTAAGYILRSYNTAVASYENGVFRKLWRDGYSNTTLKHINAFRALCGLAALNKREWVEME